MTTTLHYKAEASLPVHVDYIMIIRGCAENSGLENAGPKMQDRKMEDMENGRPGIRYK